MLRARKTRIPCPAELGYEHDGRFTRVETADVRQTVTDQLTAILRLNPGITAGKFADDLVKARADSAETVVASTLQTASYQAIRRTTGPKNTKGYPWRVRRKPMLRGQRQFAEGAFEGPR